MRFLDVLRLVLGVFGLGLDVFGDVLRLFGLRLKVGVVRLGQKIDIASITGLLLIVLLVIGFASFLSPIPLGVFLKATIIKTLSVFPSLSLLQLLVIPHCKFSALLLVLMLLVLPHI